MSVDALNPLGHSTKRLRRGTMLGVIDIGSSAIRLIVAEIQAAGEWRTLDTADRPVALGRDVFVNGRISRETTQTCLQVLLGYRELMNGYGVRHVRAIGTSALREADNRETFIDRVRLRTGIEVDIIEGIEANYLTYIAVRHCLRNFRPRLTKRDSIIMEVGGGSTEVMILQRGRMLASHTLRLGTVRMLDQISRNAAYSRFPRQLLLEDITRNVEVLRAEHRLDEVQHFIAVGGDARVAAMHHGEWHDEHYALIPKVDFQRFVDRITRLSVDETVRHLQLTYSDAEHLTPALLTYSAFVDATAAHSVIVPGVSIRDGVLLDASKGTDRAFQEEFHQQVIASARSLGRKFFHDEVHAERVTTTALHLFDALVEEHGLGDSHRTILEVSALLHDIGTYVNPASHHRHGHYLILNSDIFGLNRQVLNVVANVVRYHRRSPPTDVHESFMGLPAADRILVIKLAALLRVADALDRSHRDRLQQFDIEKSDEELIIRCRNAGELSLEKLSLAAKSDLFEETFGLRVVLV